MAEKYEQAYEAYKITMEKYRSETKTEDRKIAHDLHRAKMLGKAANFIWQKNWEAAATRFKRTQKQMSSTCNAMHRSRRGKSLPKSTRLWLLLALTFMICNCR